MVVDKFAIDGTVKGKAELDDRVFNSKINDVLVYELIRAANANIRQGTHSTKPRSFVRGGGIKPWRQKGTGRARQGSIRAPQWKGGGIVFGPLPRDYRIELPKKMKQEAYRSLFTIKAKINSIKVIEDFSLAEGKTKEMAKIGNALNIKKGILIADSEDDKLKRAIRNIDWFAFNNVNRLSSREIFYAHTLVITESALKKINEKYARG
jgi:large subunit ribosomal protein L4